MSEVKTGGERGRQRIRQHKGVKKKSQTERGSDEEGQGGEMKGHREREQVDLAGG